MVIKQTGNLPLNLILKGLYREDRKEIIGGGKDKQRHGESID